MIKYDWEKVQKLCKYKPQNIIWYLAYKSGVYTKQLKYILPAKRSLYLEAKEYPLPFGNSYILNPKDLFLNEKGCSIEEIYDYIYLASMRLYFDWKVRGDSSLHYSIAKALDIDVTYNSLLTVEKNYIYFKHEQIMTEVLNGD